MKLWISIAAACLLLSTAWADSKILRARALGEPTTFDWTRASSWAESLVVRNVMEGLVGVDPQLRIIPALAKSWTVSPDKRTFVFHLRPGVKWSDGEPLTAQQFVDSWERLLNKATNANYAYLLFDIEGAEDYFNGKIKSFADVGVKAVDKLTLEVHLREPLPSWIWIPTMWNAFPIRKDLIAKFGDLWDRPGNIVTLGPFLPTSYQVGRTVILKRNPNYYGKHGNLDEIQLALIHDDATALKLYELGQIDFVPKISSQTAVKLAGRPDFKTAPELRTIHLKLNPNQTAMKDIRVRQAIAMGIDRSKLKRLFPKAVVGGTFVPPQMEAYQASAGVKFDKAKGRALLKAAGYSETNPLVLSLISPAFDDEITLSNFIKDELAANLGVQVNVDVMEPKRYYSPVLNNQDYSLLIAFWVADYPDADNFYSAFLTNSGNNRFHWSNAKYDQTVLDARGMADKKRREAAYHKADKILLEEDPGAIPLYYGTISYLIRPAVHGFRFIPLNFYLFQEVSIYEGK